jgi:membrane protease YdiL (CAAX protease family)
MYYLILGIPELLLAVPLIVYMAVTKTGLAALMGNRTGIKQNLLALLVGVLSAPALIGLSALLQWLFSLLGANMTGMSIIEPATAGQLLVGILAIGVLAGAVEEPIFRGVILRGIGSTAGRRAAIVLTALLFSMVHLDAVGLLPRFLIGLILGTMAWRSGAILPGIFTHAAYNSTLLAVSFAFSALLPGWNGFALLPGASQDLNGALTWVLISIPFAAATWGAYRLFARATPVSSAWSEKPYAAAGTRAVHFIPWIAVGVVLLVLTALILVFMFLSADAIRQLPQFLR